MPTQSDFVQKLAAIANIDADDAMARISSMDIGNMIEIIDAVSRGDHAKIDNLLTNESDEKDESDVDADLDDEKDVEADDHEIEAEVVDADTVLSIGDEVMVGDKEGIVKIPNGPNNTVGIMIDGKLSVENRDSGNIKIKVTESVLGMSSMPDIGRIRALAGIPEEGCLGEPTNIAANVTYITKDDLAAIGMDAIMDKFDDIERALPELKVKDGKIIRQRINALMSKLNESRR